MASDFELIVLKELSEIKSVGAATAARLDEFVKNAEIENKQCFQDRANLTEKVGAIAGLQVDVATMKASQESDKRWERIHNTVHYSLAPLLLVIHGVLRHFGVEV